MAKKKKFNEAGAVAEKTVWNKAKTRKWQMTYKLVEVQASPKSKRKKQAIAANAEKKTQLKKVIKRTRLSKKKSPSKRKAVSKDKS